MAIHDCVGVHAAHAPAAQKALKEAFRETLTHPMVLEILQKTSCNGLYGPYNGPLALKEASTLSQYLFS